MGTNISKETEMERKRCQIHGVICNCKTCQFARATGSMAVIDENQFESPERLLEFVNFISFSLEREKGVDLN